MRTRIPPNRKAAVSSEPILASLESVRRLMVTKQHLAGRLPKRVTRSRIVSLVRDLPYVQWDPVTIVAPSHVISLWSRLGDFRLSDLERLLWQEKRLFLHWTPIASIVATEDYPLYASLMSRYPESLGSGWGAQKAWVRKFLAEHSDLRRKVLDALENGPLKLGQFEDHARTKRSDGDWNPGSDVEALLYLLLMRGEVMVVGHQGNQNIWGRSDQFLPSWTVRKELSEEEFEREAAQRALRALGTATPAEIKYYFPRGRYLNLRATLTRLAEESTIHRVKVPELRNPDERYIHDRDVALMESMDTSAWQPRMSLLPPFDGMVSDPARARRLFGFDYVREQFLPKDRRRFGTYVLPILWGDRFIGRIDPRLDKASGTLVINSVHAESGAPRGREVAAAVAATIARFADFLGAREVRYTARVPGAWRNSLR
jgi:uncharacterized protein